MPEATSTTQTIVYASAGVYDVQVVAPALIGLYRLTLALDDEAVPGHVEVRVICSDGLIELADGISCGCEAGEYLKADGTQFLNVRSAVSTDCKSTLELRRCEFETTTGSDVPLLLGPATVGAVSADNTVRGGGSLFGRDRPPPGVALTPSDDAELN